MEGHYESVLDHEIHNSHDYVIIALRKGRREEVVFSSRDLKKEAVLRILNDPQFPVSHSEEQRERALKLLAQITMHKILVEQVGVDGEIINKGELTSFVYDDADDVVKQLLQNYPKNTL